jgi:hypothetical protein
MKGGLSTKPAMTRYLSLFLSTSSNLAFFQSIERVHSRLSFMTIVTKNEFLTPTLTLVSNNLPGILIADDHAAVDGENEIVRNER